MNGRPFSENLVKVETCSARALGSCHASQPVASLITNCGLVKMVGPSGLAGSRRRSPSAPADPPAQPAGAFVKRNAGQVRCSGRASGPPAVRAGAVRREPAPACGGCGLPPGGRAPREDPAAGVGDRRPRPVRRLQLFYDQVRAQDGGAGRAVAAARRQCSSSLAWTSAALEPTLCLSQSVATRQLNARAAARRDGHRRMYSWQQQAGARRLWVM